IFSSARRHPLPSSVENERILAASWSAEDLSNDGRATGREVGADCRQGLLSLSEDPFTMVAVWFRRHPVESLADINAEARKPNGDISPAAGSLAHAIGQLSDAPSWIFIINADAPDGLSLRSRLNMETHDYDAMLVGAGFASLDYDDDGKKTILSELQIGRVEELRFESSCHHFSFMHAPGTHQGGRRSALNNLT
ncbi:hypothetical protein THAOC_30055, partial [Thalassiosira oceanica]